MQYVLVGLMAVLIIVLVVALRLGLVFGLVYGILYLFGLDAVFYPADFPLSIATSVAGFLALLSLLFARGEK